MRGTAASHRVTLALPATSSSDVVVLEDKSGVAGIVTALRHALRAKTGWPGTLDGAAAARRARCIPLRLAVIAAPPSP